MKSRTFRYQKQILSLTFAFALTASMMMVVIGGGGVIMPIMTTQKVFAQPGGGETSQAGEGQQIGANATTTEITATEENEMYRWTVDGNINPPITLVPNVNNTITVNNPTDTVHELVIATAQGGEEGELATSMDVQPGGKGELSIMPNATSSLRYYCEYHPQTMLGNILIANGTTTMTNQTQ